MVYLFYMRESEIGFSIFCRLFCFNGGLFSMTVCVNCEFGFQPPSTHTINTSTGRALFFSVFDC